MGIMSELSREQVEEQCQNVVYASNGDEGTHAAMNQIQYTDAALRAQLEASEQECTSWRTVLNHEREAAQKKLEAMTQERDEYKEMADWYGNLVRRAKIGTKAIPSLRAYVEQIEQQLTASEAEVLRLSVFHEDDEPSWRHRAENVEKQLAASDIRIKELENDCQRLRAVSQKD